MENPLLVFVSSVIAGMGAERQAAEAAIGAIPLSRAWVFEHAPASALPLAEAYLSKVRSCDIFVLLLRDAVSEPVKAEVATAQDAQRPILVFLWNQAPAGATAYAQSIGVKYATFADAVDLGRQVAEAVGDELITGYRRHNLPRNDLGGIGEFLDRLGQDRIVVRSEGGMVVFGPMTGGPGATVVGRDQITYNITNINPETPPQALLGAYLAHLAARCGQLPLGTVDTEFVRTSGGQPLTLPDIYVDLDVVAPAGEETAGKGRRGADAERQWALRLARGEGRERTPLLTAITAPAAQHCVLLGDAGSGKTTFVDYLTYLLATDAPSLPGPLRGRLPVHLVLRDVVARHVPTASGKGTGGMLWNALAEDVSSCLGPDAAGKLVPYVQTELLTRGGFILLDGLDEVPAAGERRRIVLEAVQDFLRPFQGKTVRTLVTARPYAYADPQWRLPKFATLALAPFDEGQVTRFVARWYQAVRPAMKWSEDTARAKGDALRRAVAERPYLGDLASRPLLLTLMATLHSSWGTLPDDRADLYEETVKLLLGRWQRAREIRRPDGTQEIEPGIAQALGIGENRLRSVLEALAYRVHARQGQDATRDNEAADIAETDLLLAFKPLLGSIDPDELQRYFRERAGLLGERRAGIYAFPHRSFQEYLAACDLANRADFAGQLRALVVQDPAWWREVCLLGIGKARQGGLGQALGVVQTLVPASPEETAEDHTPGDTDWRLAVLAGQALVELRPAQRGAAAETYQPVVRRTQRWLVQLVEGGHLAPPARAEAGDVLGQLGDPRFDAGLFHLPGRYCGQPEAQQGFVLVPAGPFVMGSRRRDPDANYWEFGNPPQLTIPYNYWIARYPVTVAQFAVFVAAGGYAEDAWWTPAGLAWQRGEWDSQVEDKNIKARLAQRTPEKRLVPMWWDDQIAYPNRPVTGVSWFEALAYAAWLDVQLKSKVSWIPPTHRVRLPTEAEWEKAARAGDGRCYPWGDEEWDEGRANIDGSQVDRPSTVGMYPRGTTPNGLHDLSGNVWEWTSSGFQDYPYQPDDGRSDPGRRVVRGGSWLLARRDARAASRGRYVPGNFRSYVGLRVVVSLSSGF